MCGVGVGAEVERREARGQASVGRKRRGSTRHEATICFLLDTTHLRHKHRHNLTVGYSLVIVVWCWSWLVSAVRETRPSSNINGSNSTAAGVSQWCVELQPLALGLWYTRKLSRNAVSSSTRRSAGVWASQAVVAAKGKALVYPSLWWQPSLACFQPPQPLPVCISLVPPCCPLHLPHTQIYTALYTSSEFHAATFDAAWHRPRTLHSDPHTSAYSH